MLDPWIIEEIRRREEDRRRDDRLPAVVELPVEEPLPTKGEQEKPSDKGEEDGPRGVTVIDFSV